jgi:tRNA-uridine 2-sulfurtransferase
MKGETVFVGMSGGVDSSVAAYLLQKAGHEVVGVFIKVWQPSFLRCHWEDERLDAMRAAAKLNIPFLTCDAEEAYRTDVAEYFIREYGAGRTPNPDVMCNRHVKFGAFHQFAKREGATRIATGHYARAEQGSLLRGVDPKKDQSYFLWNAPKDALADTLFPLGTLTKDEVRAIARSAGLPNAAKRDSQGICFLGDVDIEEFLGHYLTLTAGDVLDQSGNVIGAHKGAMLYTLGQRHGFTLAHEHAPLFVIARDISKNTITVGPQKPMHAKGALLRLCDTQAFKAIVPGAQHVAQFRYHGPEVKVSIERIERSGILLSLVDSVEAPAAGQSVVLYDHDAVVLGGIMAE